MRINLSFKDRRDGIALVIVMISVFVLTILAAGFAYSMKVETRLAMRANSDTELQWLGRSGVQYCRYILALQAACGAERFTALNQVWAGGSGGPCATNGPLADIQREIKLGNGSFTWKITDLESKANINNAGEGLLQQALTLMGVDAGSMATVSDSILDWIDRDDSRRNEGAESSAYQGLEPPYNAKNGPIDDISELLFIQGVTPELYWGPASTNNPPGTLQRRMNQSRRSAQPVFTAGLVDLFTPISSGKINLNTASAEVLQLLPGMDPIRAQEIVSSRSGEPDGSPMSMTGPFTQLDPNYLLARAGIPLELGRQMMQFCDIRSRTFQAEVTATVGSSTRTFYAIIVLGPNPQIGPQVVNFYWKLST